MTTTPQRGPQRRITDGRLVSLAWLLGNARGAGAPTVVLHHDHHGRYIELRRRNRTWLVLSEADAYTLINHIADAFEADNPDAPPNTNNTPTTGQHPNTYPNTPGPTQPANNTPTRNEAPPPPGTTEGNTGVRESQSADPLPSAAPPTLRACVHQPEKFQTPTSQGGTK